MIGRTKGFRQTLTNHPTTISGSEVPDAQSEDMLGTAGLTTIPLNISPLSPLPTLPLPYQSPCYLPRKSFSLNISIIRRFDGPSRHTVADSIPAPIVEIGGCHAVVLHGRLRVSPMSRMAEVEALPIPVLEDRWHCLVALSLEVSIL